MRARYAVFLAGALASAGCGNPACNREVVSRLFDDCGITFPVALPVCPGGLGPAGYSRMIDYFEEACAIVDPPQDADCLRFRSCEDIQQGECRTEEALLAPSLERRECLAECDRVVTSCANTCQNRAERDACYDCAADCTEDLVDCNGGCPSA